MNGFLHALLAKIGSLFGRFDAKCYENEKQIANSEDSLKRLNLARDRSTHKEVLYYLAESDPDPMVRKAVAENPAMPVHVAPILAADRNEDVRYALAERLFVLLPGLSQDKQGKLYAYAVQALVTLATDEILRIRVALSSTLKDEAHTPSEVAGKLARDIEREVAEPILRFCAALSDEDLLDILRSHPKAWAVQAVAARKRVSEPVSEAVIDTGEVEAGATLIRNEGAEITSALFEKVVDNARHLTEWHAPLAGRKDLPPDVARELAGFVETSVSDYLLSRPEFSDKTRKEITDTFRRRVEFDKLRKNDKESVVKLVARLNRQNRLTDDLIADAIGMQDREFVVAALAELTRIPPKVALGFVESKSPGLIVSLCWKAGIPMTVAVRVQQEIGRIDEEDVIQPKDGVYYPIPEEDMTAQLNAAVLKSA